jgi:hypothetical protein
MGTVDLGPALALMLGQHAAGVEQLAPEDGVESVVAFDLPLDHVNGTAELRAKPPQLASGPVVALGVRVSLVLHQRELVDPHIALAQLDAMGLGEAMCCGGGQIEKLSNCCSVNLAM